MKGEKADEFFLPDQYIIKYVDKKKDYEEAEVDKATA
jgi:hypothetical protein